VFSYNDSLVVISQGTPSLVIAVSSTFKQEYLKSLPKIFDPTDNDMSLCGFELPSWWTRDQRTDNVTSTFWFTSDIKYITGAVDWLMHVLTGPDPRTYDSPLDPSLQNRQFRDQFKEASEPESYFVFEPHGSNFILKRRLQNQPVNKLKYFLVRQETADASAYVRVVLTYLNSPGIFTENLAKFSSTSLDNELKREAAKIGLTWELFQKALLRMKQYEQHEFLGCGICGTETKYRCSVSKIPYCSVECQMVATVIK
jgi:hypothetical protein